MPASQRDTFQIVTWISIAVSLWCLREVSVNIVNCGLPQNYLADYSVLPDNPDVAMASLASNNKKFKKS